MKLLCLNIWGGRQGQKLFDYLSLQARDTDIFCFQEVFDFNGQVLGDWSVRVNLLTELKNVLPGFTAYYDPSYYGWIDEHKAGFNVSSGQAIFIKNSLVAVETGSVYIYGNAATEIKEDFTNEPKTMQWARIISSGKEFLVANAHGKWHPGEKLDTPERIKQSEIINGFLKGFDGPKILCGDFNLMPQTQSVKILQQGLTNLITGFKIETTRNEVSWKQYNNKQYFADYTFVSPGISVNSFEVPYNEVSDHLPMVVEFSIERLKD